MQLCGSVFPLGGQWRQTIVNIRQFPVDGHHSAIFLISFRILKLRREGVMAGFQIVNFLFQRVHDLLLGAAAAGAARDCCVCSTRKASL